MQFIRALVSVLNVPGVILLSLNLQSVLDFIANNYFGSEWNLIVLNYILDVATSSSLALHYLFYFVVSR